MAYTHDTHIKALEDDIEAKIAHLERTVAKIAAGKRTYAAKSATRTEVASRSASIGRTIIPDAKKALELAKRELAASRQRRQARQSAGWMVTPTPATFVKAAEADAIRRRVHAQLATRSVEVAKSTLPNAVPETETPSIEVVKEFLAAGRSGLRPGDVDPTRGPAPSLAAWLRANSPRLNVLNRFEPLMDDERPTERPRPRDIMPQDRYR